MNPWDDERPERVAPPYADVPLFGLGSDDPPPIRQRELFGDTPTVSEGEIMSKPMPEPPAAEQYPECAKLDRVRPASQVQGELLDWLINDQEIVLAVHNDEGDLVWYGHGIEAILAKFHGIDLAKVEAERRAMLGFHLREAQRS